MNYLIGLLFIQKFPIITEAIKTAMLAAVADLFFPAYQQIPALREGHTNLEKHIFCKPQFLPHHMWKCIHHNNFPAFIFMSL